MKNSSAIRFMVFALIFSQCHIGYASTPSAYSGFGMSAPASSGLMEFMTARQIAIQEEMKVLDEIALIKTTPQAGETMSEGTHMSAIAVQAIVNDYFSGSIPKGVGIISALEAKDGHVHVLMSFDHNQAGVMYQSLMLKPVRHTDGRLLFNLIQSKMHLFDGFKVIFDVESGVMKKVYEIDGLSFEEELGTFNFKDRVTADHSPTHEFVYSAVIAAGRFGSYANAELKTDVRRFTDSYLRSVTVLPDSTRILQYFKKTAEGFVKSRRVIFENADGTDELVTFFIDENLFTFSVENALSSDEIYVEMLEGISATFDVMQAAIRANAFHFESYFKAGVNTDGKLIMTSKSTSGIISETHVHELVFSEGRVWKSIERNDAGTVIKEAVLSGNSSFDLYVLNSSGTNLNYVGSASVAETGVGITVFHIEALSQTAVFFGGTTQGFDPVIREPFAQSVDVLDHQNNRIITVNFSQIDFGSEMIISHIDIRDTSGNPVSTMTIAPDGDIEVTVYEGNSAKVLPFSSAMLPRYDMMILAEMITIQPESFIYTYERDDSVNPDGGPGFKVFIRKDGEILETTVPPLPEEEIIEVVSEV